MHKLPNCPIDSKFRPLRPDFRGLTAQIFSVFHIGNVQQAQPILPCFRSKSLAIQSMG